MSSEIKRLENANVRSFQEKKIMSWEVRGQGRRSGEGSPKGQGKHLRVCACLLLLLIYNIMLVSSVQQNDSGIYIHTSSESFPLVFTGY